MRVRGSQSAALVATLLTATAVHAAELRIEVTDIEAVEGKIMLAMYDSAEGFDDGQAAPVYAVGVDVDGTTVSWVVPDLAAGTYAIKLYHDANGNGEMDSNLMGLPIEGYGFSGNGGRFGPPPFEKAAFEVVEDGDNQVSIRLR